jgi:biopolymer transport protein ExbB/TolQ
MAKRANAGVSHAGRARPAGYAGTWALLALAAAFPFSLMVTNPTLMFERGWEQYAGTTIYLAAVVMLARELRRLGRDETAFAVAETLVARPESAEADDDRVLPARIRALHAGAKAGGGSLAQLVELNRESSALDQEHAAGRFTLTRYILYLLPVIGFIGTVEGISKALMNISKVLPMVKELDGFLDNLTGVTAALQIAFDSTLLALFLSAVLMFVQTIVLRRSEDLLARVDRWVGEHVLPRFARVEAGHAGLEALPALLERLEGAIATLDSRLAPPVERFAAAIDRLAPAVGGLTKGAEAMGALGPDLASIGQLGESARKATATLARIEAALAAADGSDEQLDAIRRGIDRTNAGIESLANQFSNAFERNSRTTQEQLARTMNSLKEALDLLHVSMEQSNALYRSIVKRVLPVYPAPNANDDLAA